MQYVGMDVHWRQTAICILDENGRRVKMMNVRGASEFSARGAWDGRREANLGGSWGESHPDCGGAPHR